MKPLSAGLLFILGALALFAAPAQAVEEILDYRSHIEVERDASLLITETIRVRAEGARIKRGIFRWFPVRYKAPWGGRVKIPFEVVRVLRDGKPEPWHTRSEGDGVSVYVGKADVLLRPGTYSYTLVFRTGRQIGFFKDFDELYFNAIGHRWLFTIRKATVTVELPKDTGYLRWEAFTGPVGSRGKSYDDGRDADGNLTFTTTYPLYPRQGMTVSVRFPKGAVAEPGGMQKFLWFLWDNQASAILLAGLVVVGLYFLIVWWQVGRDPRGGAIIPLFGPPKGFSPAACRFLLNMGYDRKGFAAAIVDLAVKGYLRIKQSGKTFTLIELGENRKLLSDGEAAAARKLFARSKTCELKNKNAARISAAIKALKASLSGEYEKGFFLRNQRQFYVGAALSLVFAAIAAFSVDEDTAFILIFMTVWAGFVVFAIWRSVTLLRGGSRVVPVLLLAFAVGGGLLLILLLVFLAGDLPVVALVCFCALGAMNVLFFELMKAPTREGRQIMDEIEGFRMYLAVGEKERLDLVNPPEETPQLFEKFLPYALALDVETRWAARFGDVLERAGKVHGTSGYVPAWYFVSRGSSFSAESLTSTLSGSFANATASASVAPGSSSGGGGGGFSGGGGGGGGGGGW